MKRLPDAEFEIMKIVWDSEPPITTATIMETLGQEKNWKPQTVITLMLRLVEHGFLRTEKTGRERSYWPLVAREEYLEFETGNFVTFYHDNSFTSLVTAFLGGKQISEDEVKELRQLVNSLARKNRDKEDNK